MYMVAATTELLLPTAPRSALRTPQHGSDNILT